MNLKHFAAAAALALVTAAPTLADEAPYRHHHRHYHHHYHSPLPYPISYLHNYGPGVTPGSFAFYDGPSTNHCFQGSAAYIGQDRQRHPCF